jgi:ABC-type branched-subunit amino acid transport system permease subunit
VDAALFAQLLIYGLTDGAVVALNAVGFSLAYSVARQINLAHGSVFALTTVVVANLASFTGATAAAPLPLRILWLLLFALAGAAFGAILNAAIERLAFKPFRAVKDPLAPLIASVALSFVLMQAAVWWHDLRFVAPPGAHQGVDLPLLAMPDLIPRLELGPAGVSFTLKDLLVLTIATLVAVGGAAWLARSRTGRLLRAVAQDPETTMLMGGDPARANLVAFAVGGAVAGFGAAIFAAYFGGANAQYGLRSGLAAMTAAVLGGVGDPRGALLGGIVLGIVSSFSDYLLDAQWTPVLVLLLLIALLAFRPSGLLGTTSVATDLEAATRPVLAAVRGSRLSRRVLVVLFAVGALYPLVGYLTGSVALAGVTSALVMVTLAVGLTLVVGFAGLLDLGYAAFFAIGAYTAAVLTSSGSRIAMLLPEVARNPLLGLAMAGLVAAGFGVLFGLPSVRTRGEYLAIVTLAFGEIVPLVIWHLGDWTGGPRGMSGIPGVRLDMLPSPLSVLFSSPSDASSAAAGATAATAAAAIGGSDSIASPDALGAVVLAVRGVLPALAVGVRDALSALGLAGPAALVAQALAGPAALVAQALGGPAAPAGLGSYFVALAVAGLACLAVMRLTASRIGRAWAAVREDDTSAASLGIDPALLKLVAFGVGAGVAGVAGAVFAQVFGYVEPGQFDFVVSLMVLSAVVVGGRWGVPGAVFGALAIALYDRLVVEGLTTMLRGLGATLHLTGLQALDLRQHSFVIFGLALYVATLYRARGMQPSVASDEQPASVAVFPARPPPTSPADVS